jgi:hypothetical protein
LKTAQNHSKEFFQERAQKRGKDVQAIFKAEKFESQFDAAQLAYNGRKLDAAITQTQVRVFNPTIEGGQV